MKYRLTRDDGVEIDVPGGVWESTLDRAFRNGWIPAGTGAPARQGGRWAEADYFSASSQYVREADALELGTAVIDPLACGDRDPTGIQRVGAFARRGGFTIGRAPEGGRVSDGGRAPSGGRGPEVGRAPDASRAADAGRAADASRAADANRAADSGRASNGNRAPDPGRAPEGPRAAPDG